MLEPSLAAPRTRARMALIVAAAAVLGLLVLAWSIVPMIARGIAPRTIERAFARQFHGSAKVRQVSLGWRAPMVIESLEILDDKGRRVGTLRAQIPTGLWGLLGGARDMRTIRVRADLAIVDAVDAGGRHSSNLARAFSVRTAGDWKLPKGYRAAVELEPSNITYQEVGPGGETLSEAAVTGLSGSGQLYTRHASGSLKGSVRSRVSGGTRTRLGAVDLTLSVTDLTDARGTVQLAKADVEVHLTATQAPMRMVDAMLGLHGAAWGALGESADVTLVGRGTRSKATVSRMTIAAPNTTADLAFDIDGGKVTVTRPGSIQIVSTDFLTRMPRVREAMAHAGISIEQAPALDVSIRSLAMPLDSAADLRGSSLDIAIETGVTRISVPGTRPRGPRRDLVFAPGAAHLTSADLAGSMSCTGSIRASLDGKPAGVIRSDLRLHHLLDRTGRWRRVPGSLGGSVSASGVRAELLGPILATTGLPIDARVDIGTTVDATLTAENSTARGTDADVIRTNLDLVVRSANLRVNSEWRLGPDRLETRDRGLDVRMAGTSRLMERILSARLGAPVTTVEPGALHITSRRLSIPLQEGKPSGKGAAGDIRFAWTNALLAPARARSGGGPPVPPVRVDSLTASLRLAALGAPRVVLGGRLSRQAHAVTATGDVTIDGLWGDTKPERIGGLGTARLSGSFELQDLPATVIESLGLVDGDLIAGIAGDRITVTVQLVGAAARQAVKVQATSSVLAAEVGFELGRALEILQADAVCTMTVASARSLLLAIGLDQDSMRELRLPLSSRIDARIRPVSIPLVTGSLSPDYERIGTQAIAASVTMSQPLSIENLRVRGNTISGGLSALAGTASVPVAALGPKKRRAAPITGVLEGILVRTSHGRAEQMATLDANLSVKLDGPLSAHLRVKDIQTRLVDEMLGRSGFISGALGETAALTITASRPPGAATIGMLLNLESSHLAARDWRVETGDGFASVIGPATAEWRIEPAWANRHLVAPAPTSRRSAAWRVTGTTAARVHVDRLKVSLPHGRDGASGPFEPGVFAINASVAVPRVDVTWRDEPRFNEGPKSAPTPVTHAAVLQDVSFSAASQPDGTVQLLGKIAKIGDGAAGIAGSADATLVLSELGDPTGAPGNPTIAGNVEVHSFPTTLLDGFTDPRGGFRDALGPSMDVSARLVGLGTEVGTLSVSIDSTRATMTVYGRIRDGAFAVLPRSAGSTDLRRPAMRVELLEISETLGRKMVGPLFTVSSVYKTRQDGPGFVTSDDLQFPVDGDMRKLNGNLRVDLGTARFPANSDLFSGLVRILGQSSGTIGRRTAPFDVKITSGVARFEDVQVPLGEFTCGSSGSIDLVHDSLDVLVWVPATQVTDEALGVLSVGVGGMMNRLLPRQIANEVMVPFRVRGRISDPGKPQVDAGLFLKRFGSRLVNMPGKVIVRP